jgi:hypothetical protein
MRFPRAGGSALDGQLLQVFNNLLLRHQAQVHHFARLRHVVGQLLVAPRDGLVQRGFDALQVLH